MSCSAFHLEMRYHSHCAIVVRKQLVTTLLFIQLPLQPPAVPSPPRVHPPPPPPHVHPSPAKKNATVSYCTGLHNMFVPAGDSPGGLRVRLPSLPTGAWSTRQHTAPHARTAPHAHHHTHSDQGTLVSCPG